MSFIAVQGCYVLKTEVLRFCINNTIGDIVEYSFKIGDFARETDKWYVLTDTEIDSVFSNEHIKINYWSSFSVVPQDIKERKLKIAVKKDAQKSYQVMVWSRGFDNISGTDDDIICSNCDNSVFNVIK